MEPMHSADFEQNEEKKESIYMLTMRELIRCCFQTIFVLKIW